MAETIVDSDCERLATGRLCAVTDGNKARLSKQKKQLVKIDFNFLGFEFGSNGPQKYWIENGDFLIS
jgi:hypothetical protein